jgi:hypothetical protein
MNESMNWMGLKTESGSRSFPAQTSWPIVGVRNDDTPGQQHCAETSQQSDNRSRDPPETIADHHPTAEPKHEPQEFEKVHDSVSPPNAPNEPRAAAS